MRSMLVCLGSISGLGSTLILLGNVPTSRLVLMLGSQIARIIPPMVLGLKDVNMLLPLLLLL